jgi:PKD repeat protein
MAFAAAAGCDKVPLLAPTSSTITLFVSNGVLPLNGVTEIIANVIEPAGTPVHNGTLVTFTTNLGSIEPREARTEGGQVTARLFAGDRSGTARVGALSGGAKATEVEVLIGGAAAARVTLNVSPGTVGASGGTVLLLATVTDQTGNPVPGVRVVFTSTAGTLGATSVPTDETGVARNTLTTTREATVTATAGAQTDTETVRVNDAPSISITPSATPAVEEQPTSFSITVTRAPNGASIRNVTVDFGDLTTLSLGALTGTTTVPHTYRRAGTYTVTATVTDINGDSNSVITQIVVGQAPPVGVNLTASNTAPQVNQSVTFTATVTPANTVVRAYVWDFGDGRSTTTTGNTAGHVYTGTGRRTITVTVFADTGIGEGQTEINVIAVPTTPTTPTTPTIPGPTTPTTPTTRGNQK